MPKVSIIVPVYKVEKYLRECLDSILAQSFTDWECLLIDDGSPDKSGEICDEYASKDNRCRVFHIENGGVSRARNIGIENMKGEWVMFVDSDDAIAPNTLEFCYEKAVADNLDALQFSFTRNKDDIGKNNGVFTEILSPVQYARMGKMNVCVGGALFKSEIVQANSLRFDERISLGEDQLFFYSYIQYCSRIQRLGDALYFYRVNANSATHHQKTAEILKSLYCFVLYKQKQPAWSAPIDSTLIVFITDMIISQEVSDKVILSTIKECHIRDYSMMNNSYKLICVLMNIMPQIAIYYVRLRYSSK